MNWTLSAEADEDLADIFVASVLRFGWDQAERYQDGLEAKFQPLSDSPLIGRQIHGKRLSAWVFPVQSHVIVYSPEGEDLTILRIFHQHQDWARYFT